MMLASALLTLAVAAQAQPGARQQANVIMPENPRQRQVQDTIGWSTAVVSNGIVYVSGEPVAPRPGETDMEAAFVRAFEALGKTLVRAGVSWNDVVEIRSFHTDPNAQIDAMAKVKLRYVDRPHPAWTAVGTNALLQPGGIAEIALVAHVPKGAPAR